MTYLTAKGYLSIPERSFLVDLAHRVPPDGLILEIGGEWGASTVCLRTGNPSATIVTIDWFRQGATLQEHQAQLAEEGITDTIQIVGDSRKVVNVWCCPIDLLFIDGGHDYETARSDCRFARHVVLGGYLAFHDYYGDHPLHAEVRQAVDEWLQPRAKQFEELPRCDSIRAFRRVQ